MEAVVLYRIEDGWLLVVQVCLSVSTLLEVLQASDTVRILRATESRMGFPTPLVPAKSLVNPTASHMIVTAIHLLADVRQATNVGPVRLFLPTNIRRFASHQRRLLTRVQRPRRPFTRREPQPTSSQQQSLSSPLVPHPENETEPSENRAEPAHHLADYSPAEDDATESTEERTGSYGWKWPAAWKSAAWVSRRAPLPGIDIAPTDAPAQGVYLISHPLLGFAPPNSIFHRSVVLLVDHTDTHSYGLIVNKDRDMTLREVCSPGAMPLALDEFSCFADSPVRVGGPVGNCFSWLHRHEEVGGVRFPDNTESPVKFLCFLARFFMYVFVYDQNAGRVKLLLATPRVRYVSSFGRIVHSLA